MIQHCALWLCFLGLLAAPLVVRANEMADRHPAAFVISDDVEAGTDKFRITPYGSLWGNMLYATRRVFPGEFTLFVFSPDEQGEDAFTTDARRSRLGLDVVGPKIRLAGGLHSGGRVEIDFLGEFVDENQPQARLRHVYWEARNEQQRILVGQTWDVISPLWARSVNFSAGWLGGNIGFRRAQFRYERFQALPHNLAGTLQVSLNQDITPDYQDTRLGLVPPAELGPMAPGEAVTFDWMVK